MRASLSCSFVFVTAVLFTEDAGSVLYTQKKSEAAARCGIGKVLVLTFPAVDRT